MLESAVQEGGKSLKVVTSFLLCLGIFLALGAVNIVLAILAGPFVYALFNVLTEPKDH